MSESCRLRALDRSRRYLGVHEEPDGSNRGPDIDRWCKWAAGVVGYPWCSAFVCGMVREACGLVVPTPQRASVESLTQWAQRTGELLPERARPRAGDLICYDWNSDEWYDHVGFVERVLGTSWSGGHFHGLVRTIEGNSGNAVRRHVRRCASVRFIRLNADKLTPVE